MNKDFKKVNLNVLLLDESELSLSLCYVHPGTSGTQKSVPFSPLSRWMSLFRAYFWGPFVRLITDYADEVAPGNPERSAVV